MSRASLNKSQYGSRRVRKISTTESEYSFDEQAQRLTIGQDGMEDPSPEDDGASICEYHDIPPPPDGGYGWVIVFASFMCNMIVDGIAYTFGIFMKEFEVYFGVSSSKVAWVGSLLSGVYLMAGPVVSALTNKFGCRVVCIAGSFIGAAAFVLSTFSTSVNMLMMTYGVLGGVGFGLIYLPAVVCVGYYFETKRSLATGIAVCGSGFGTFAFAPLARLLLDTYQWKGANLILAGLILNCAVFGALMRPLTYPKCSNVKPLLQRMAEEKRFQMERGSIGGSYFLVQLPDGSMEKRMKMPINIDPGVHSSFNLDQLVPGTPLTPVPTVPTLPTISEVKVQEHSSSSHTSNSESVESKGSLVKSSSKPESTKESPKESPSRESPKESRDTNSKEEPEAQPAKSSIPRNASQPSFTTHVQGLPKNGSVPFFDRIRKTSAGERYKPSVQAMKNAATRAAANANPGSNVEVRKSFQLRLSTSSMLGGSKNNNSAEMDDGESITFSTSKNSVAATHREKSLIVRPLSRKDIFYSGSIYCLPEYQSQKSLANYRQSVLSLPKSSRGIDRNVGSKREVEAGLQPMCPCFELPDSFRDALSTMLDMSLLKNPIFFFICLSNIFGMAGLYIPFFYLVEAAKKRGIDVNSASFLLSVIGVTNTVGRVACGYVADFPNVDSLLLNNICLIISTITMVFTVFCSTYTHFILMSFFFGMAISGYISLTSIILVDLLGLEKLTNAFGLLILFRGVAAIGGPPIAGKVYDMTQNYDLTFYMAAFFFFLSTVASFVAPMMNRCTKEQAQPIVLDILTPIDEEDIEDEEMEDEIPEIIETTPSPQESIAKDTKESE